ncbi:hypothetical protein [Paenibacillus polymyxa]|uniref:hypothetical protein n=1 Tax=Paenibacillus polymyxa TaxID=1406 RepID=UPI0025B70257|nr:hypothetical protein [Paenibacillus polymyxa]MDN4106123.1 hypothetical protein [Paenibacillus polymyxa]
MSEYLFNVEQDIESVVDELRSDEITEVNGREQTVISDSFERLLWEFSSNNLDKLKGDLVKGKFFAESKMTYDFINIINKILA